MLMKVKFFLLTFLLLFARGCDFYSTSLWFFDNPTGEQNLLYKFFNVGWSGLILANVVIVALILYCFYVYTFKYTIQKVNTKPGNLQDYISTRYFGQQGRFYEILYKMPSDRKTLIGHSGYVLVRVIIVASFLATIHNLCQFYNVPFYNTFREIVGRPLFVIAGLILLSLVFFTYKLWKKEYGLAREWFDQK